MGRSPRPRARQRCAISSAMAAALDQSPFSSACSSCSAAHGRPSAAALPRKALSILSTPKVKWEGRPSSAAVLVPDAASILARRARKTEGFADVARGTAEAPAGADLVALPGSESILFMICSNLVKRTTGSSDSMPLASRAQLLSAHRDRTAARGDRQKKTAPVQDRSGKAQLATVKAGSEKARHKSQSYDRQHG